MRLGPSPRATKRYRATFNNGRATDFGQRGGSTYIDHGDKDKRAAYIARHSKNDEDWNDPYTAGALSRHLLWGPTTSLQRNLAAYRRRFRL